MDVDVMGLVVNAYDGSYGGCCCCDAMLAIAAAVRGVQGGVERDEYIDMDELKRE